MEDLIYGTIAAIDGELIGKIFSAITAIAVAYNAYKTYQLQVLTLASKKVSEGNAEAIAQVSTQGRENAEAIEHTRVQNVRIRSAVEDTKVQNTEIAEAVGHVHICVETKVAELKEVVEKVPEAVKEAVPVAIKEVVPDVIKETLPEVVATLK